MLRVTITTNAKLAALPAPWATSSHAASPAKRRAAAGASAGVPRTSVDRSVMATGQWWQTVHLALHRSSPSRASRCTGRGGAARGSTVGQGRGPPAPARRARPSPGSAPAATDLHRLEGERRDVLDAPLHVEAAR